MWAEGVLADLNPVPRSSVAGLVLALQSAFNKVALKRPQRDVESRPAPLAGQQSMCRAGVELGRFDDAEEGSLNLDPPGSKKSPLSIFPGG